MQAEETKMILRYFGGIEAQLDDVNIELAELRDRYNPIKGIAMDGMPHGSTPGDSTASLAVKLADDFGISYDNRQKHRIKPHIREPTPEQRYRQEESRCYKVLSDYFHHLRTWKQQYAPKHPEDEWHPLFVEALQRESHIEYLLDVLLYGTAEEKKALVAEQRKEVMNLEQRFAEHPDEHDRGGSQRKSGLDR